MPSLSAPPSQHPDVFKDLEAPVHFPTYFLSVAQIGNFLLFYLQVH